MTGAVPAPDAALTARLLRVVEAQRAERLRLVAELEQAVTRTERLEVQARLLEQERDAARAEAALRRAEGDVARGEAALLRGERDAALADAGAARRETSQTHALYGQAFSSRSWRWTAPLRGEWRPSALALRSRASRPALARVEVQPQRALPTSGPSTPRTAVVAHLFYPDLWDDLRAQLGNLQFPYDLHVTLTERASAHLAGLVREQVPGARVTVLPNRGRDVAPFAHLLHEGHLDGYGAVLKLHGKRSRHRGDGDDWRQALWHGLLPDPASAQHFARLVASHPDVGALVPLGNVHGPESVGSNAERVRELLARVGLEPDLGTFTFPAGSMYWLDGSTVELLKALRLDPVADFEPEEGQVDGTTAHAFERLLGILLERRGQRVLATEEARGVGVEPDWASRATRPRVLAFYLPQYHRDPVNDRFWGDGFTDWDKVEQARPWHPLQRFPRRPTSALGRYDLADPAVLPQQAALAREHGVDGFLVYHYWFSGQRVLARPAEQLRGTPDADVPYALVWANENWTRSWDGLDGEVLLQQRYEDGWVDGLLSSLEPSLRDPRYLRLDGRPLLVLFKPGLVPDLAGAVQRLRALARDRGLGELHVAGVLHDRHAPAAAHDGDALDSWMEFPPLSGPPPQERADESNPQRGRAYSYRGLADAPQRPYLVDGRPVHPGVMPGWDNTPRRAAGASAFPDANPADFRRWLLAVRKRLAATSAPCELVVTVNAWNEWAETAHLEPDDRAGRANLEAVRSVFGPVQP